MASLTGFSGRKGGYQSDFAGIDNKPFSANDAPTVTDHIARLETTALAEDAARTARFAPVRLPVATTAKSFAASILYPKALFVAPMALIATAAKLAPAMGSAQRAATAAVTTLRRPSLRNRLVHPRTETMTATTTTILSVPVKAGVGVPTVLTTVIKAVATATTMVPARFLPRT
ncbi:hypothetical protein B0J13DRAFT_519975 [Dactylonectria estremocensis]|uniref:Uncharacterized protein n=1 Tax=Dactylonectria estremocensis TaxID=1079267 RepID=A0A9P9FEZ6_9HYPO|nr:hypothetical protein B0J13DRAFT_519975 [Dactylonectria estremocensis]